MHYKNLKLRQMPMQIQKIFFQLI